MNWEAIGAMGETVGAIAVVVTVAYLAIQTRQANKLAKSIAALILQSEDRSHRNSQALDGELAGIIQKALQGAELNEVERLRYRARYNSSLSLFESIFYQIQNGILPLEYLSRYESDLRAMVTISTHLGIERSYGMNEFDAYVQNLLDDKTA